MTSNERRITSQIEASKYTLIEIDPDIPGIRYNAVVIEGKEYETEIVFDLKNHIAIIGKGDFVGKKIVFIWKN